MRSAMHLGLACILVLACGGKPPTEEGSVQPRQASTPDPWATKPAAHRKPLSANDAAIAKLTEFADQMCACHDVPCAERVNAVMVQWSEEMQRNVGKVPREWVDPDPSGTKPEQAPSSSGLRMPPPAVMERMEAITKQYVDCFTRVMQAGEG